MLKGPFIDDPREVMRQQIALAVASPIEVVRAIHLRAAEHQAGLARDCGLPMQLKDGVDDGAAGRRRRHEN